MKHFYYRCKHRFKLKKIIGIVLGIIGLLIVINIIPIEVLLFIVGIVLIIMGFLVLKTK